jgi:hypothetical protein
MALNIMSLVDRTREPLVRELESCLSLCTWHYGLECVWKHFNATGRFTFVLKILELPFEMSLATVLAVFHCGLR